MSALYGFTIHGTILADTAQGAEDTGSPLIDTLFALPFVNEAEVWIDLEPETEPTENRLQSPSPETWDKIAEQSLAERTEPTEDSSRS